MTPAADAISDVLAPAAPAGVRLDDGEVVLMSLRQHWSVPMALGGAPSLLLVAFLGTLSFGRQTPMPPTLLGILTALALTPLIAAMLRHATRRYVLTDRRVMLRHGRDVRWVALPAVHAVETNAPAGKPGDVRFRSAQGVLVWHRVPDARAAAAAAREAVDRYGRG